MCLHNVLTTFGVASSVSLAGLQLQNLQDRTVHSVSNKGEPKSTAFLYWPDLTWSQCAMVSTKQQEGMQLQADLCQIYSHMPMNAFTNPWTILTCAAEPLQCR
jgi:hypothetical protein